MWKKLPRKTPTYVWTIPETAVLIFHFRQYSPLYPKCLSSLWWPKSCMCFPFSPLSVNTTLKFPSLRGIISEKNIQSFGKENLHIYYLCLLGVHLECNWLSLSIIQYPINLFRVAPISTHLPTLQFTHVPCATWIICPRATQFFILQLLNAPTNLFLHCV